MEASTQLLHALAADTGMAFVLVHHLSPGRVSMLPEILGRATSMPVRAVEDRMPVEPNHVYVIPPGTSMELRGGALCLVPRGRADGGYRPVDHFLRSLAAEQGYRSIAVILSGTASDGTAGCEAVKAEGGITFAQDESAQQESMPRSAVLAGCVDFVLSPKGIAREIARIARHPLVGPAGNGAPPGDDANHLSGILELLRYQTGVDFSHYKRNTMLRRIARRMVLHKVDEIGAYHRFLTGTPGEAEELFQDILINVTHFFRNPTGFDALKQQVFPALTRDRDRPLPVRIWVLGCSTGEEAYSVAITFSEFAASQGRAIPVQLFASDLNFRGIEKARHGLYSKAIEQDVSPERLRRYFLPIDGGYKIAKPIRDMVVFARHNALHDPPFSRLDLITCRNLLIYLDPILQQRLIPSLHYALNPGGFLWLGESETAGASGELFEPCDPRHKIYRRKPVTALPGALRRDLPRPVPAPLPEDKPRGLKLAGLDPHVEADRLLLTRFAPPGVLVNAHFEIVHFRGDASLYLSPSPGRASLDLLKMLREGLVTGVRAALLKAKREGRPARQENLTIRTGGARIPVSVEVIPVRTGPQRETGFLVMFDTAASKRARARPEPVHRVASLRGPQAAAELARLQQELAATREYLQSVIEQQEAANEELQSANEEVQSSNEELQSINEELETSKEELQSSSEELATVNDELSNRNLELSLANNDLTNLISSVQIPIVMLGPDFRIRRFTPSAEKLLNLIATDLGRSINDIKAAVELPNLEAMLAEVMETVTPREELVRDRNGRWYSLRLRPYRTTENTIDGVVMLLVDIHSLKDAEESVRRSAERLSVLQEQAPLGIREVDPEGRFLLVNQSYCAITGYSRDELLGRRFQEFLPPEDRAEATELLLKLLAGELPSIREERRHLHKSGRPIWVEVHGFALRDAQGKPVSGVAFVQDISERRQADTELRAADRAKNEFIAMLAHELRNPLAPLLNAAQVLADPDLPRERVQALRAILERQIHSLSRMTDDLLDVSRISRGQIRLHPEVVELGSIVRRAIDLFRPALETQGLQLEIQIPAEPIYLEADPVRLEQVVDNLLTNAAKFTDSGGHVRIILERHADPPPGIAELRVEDDGQGISPELLPHIFEPFIQGEQALDRTMGGLGIGLTLVRSITQLHGGSVTVESKGRGRGALFTVRLPLPPRPVQTTPDRRRELPGSAPHRVLIVDDNPDAAETLAMLMRHHGHDVRVAHDGDTAIEESASYRPDVVLLDIGLPGKSGIEVARELRAQLGPERFTLIAVSGYGQDDLRVQAREAGITYYYTKPVDIGNLLRLFATLP